MSEAVAIAVVTGAFTFAGLAVNAWFTYKNNLVNKRVEVRLAKIAAKVGADDEASP